MLQLLFIDGIGGRRIFRTAFLKQLGRLGIDVDYFSYSPSRETLSAVRGRLEHQLHQLAARGPLVLVGYSF